MEHLAEYHGKISKKRAEEILGEAGRDGSYLIRDSERLPNSYCACVLWVTSQTSVCRITVSVCSDWHLYLVTEHVNIQVWWMGVHLQSFQTKGRLLDDRGMKRFKRGLNLLNLYYVECNGTHILDVRGTECFIDWHICILLVYYCF